MLRGLTTVNYWADDLEAAKTWFADLLSIEPERVAAHEPGLRSGPRTDRG